MNDISNKKLIRLGQAVIKIESESVKQLHSRIDDSFSTACRIILACSGRVICIGMGKSGHIGGKIAATLASTGTPAFFVHPGEASHGDLGMVTVKDVVIALSNSGETEELLTLLPIIKRLNIPLIAITGNKDSTLSKAARAVLDVSVEKEACPLGLAPTSSTTAALAIGDALAVALLTARGFDENDFALSHPGGSLGRRLLLHVSDIMHTGNEIPVVSPQTPFTELLLVMTEKGLGTTIITEQNGQDILGIFTDGDIRRVFDMQTDLKQATAADIMIKDCKTVNQSLLAAEALQIMESSKINALPVVNDNDQLVGIINMHDLLRAKVV